MMTDVEDEDDWATSDELADDDNDSNAVVAESALDRYICLNIIISIRGCWEIPISFHKRVNSVSVISN